MKVLITTLGSTGDLIPYLGLAQTLKQRGHSVVICTHLAFSKQVVEAGLEYAPMNNGFIELLQSSLGQQTVSGLDRVTGFFKTLWRLRRTIRSLQTDALTDSWYAANKHRPDIILYNSKTSWAIDFAEFLHITAIPAFLFPQWESTREFPSLGLPAANSSKGWRGAWHKFSYRITGFIAARLSKGVITRWRAQHKLPRAEHLGLTADRTGHPLPELLGYSAHLLPSPQDWPKQIHVTGFWRSEPDMRARLNPELEAFLEKGLDEKDKPVYIGFGSMGSRKAEQLTSLMVNELRRLGIRAVIATGWGGLSSMTSDADILFIESAPHYLLFPRVKAVICHGGAGTVSAALHAGKPLWICPFFGDQLVWASQVEKLGLGPAGVPARKLTRSNFGAAVQALMMRQEYQQNAEQLAVKLNDEQGTTLAAEVIEALFSH